MSRLSDIEFEFVHDDLALMQEFDMSNFVANAKTAISGKVALVEMKHKINHYSAALQKAIAEVQSIEVDTSSISDFLAKLNNFEHANASYTVRDVSVSNINVLKPQYLDQYTMMLVKLIDRVINDSIERDEVDKYLIGDAVARVKKQVVKTKYGEDSALAMVRKDGAKYVPLTQAYVKTTLLPFVSNAEKLKNALVTEANAVLRSLQEAESNVNGILTAVNQLKESDAADALKLKKVDYVVYNGIRGYLDLLSYITYMEIRKLTEFGANVYAAEKIYYDVTNNYHTVGMEESVMTNVLPTDAASLTEDLEAGRIGPFEVISSNLYEYHHNNPYMGIANGNLKSTGDVLHSVFDMQIDFTGYSKKAYDDVVKMYIEISNGLDILAKNSDEYLLIFEDLKSKAGFTLSLEDRFRATLDGIDDLSNYAVDVPGITDTNKFVNMLAEVKDFPENMNKIASTIVDVKAKMSGIKERYDNNINGEFKDAEALNELKILMSDLTEQLRVVDNIVGTKFMARLRALGEKLTAITVKVEDPMGENNVVPDVDLDHTDYRRENAICELDEMREAFSQLFESVQLDYIKERERARRGVNVFTEADVTQPATNTPAPAGGNTNNATDSTKPTVVDNGANNANNGGTVSGAGKILDAIKNFINTFLTNLQRSSDKNTKWIIDNKQELLNRGYENVTVNILPYQQLPYQQMIGKINEVTTVVRGLSPQALQSLGDEQAAYSRVLSPITGGVSKNGNVSADAQLINFFTTGKTTGSKVVAIANGDLQRMVASEMIPYCESYSGQFSQSLQRALNDLGAAADDMANKAAQGTQPNQTQNANTAGNMAQVSKWAGNAVKDLSKAALNAAKQRNNDYLKVLSSLVPKTPANPVQPTNGQQEQNAAANNAAAQTTQQQAVQPTVTQQ